MAQAWHGPSTYARGRVRGASASGGIAGYAAIGHRQYPLIGAISPEHPGTDGLPARVENLPR